MFAKQKFIIRISARGPILVPLRRYAGPGQPARSGSFTARCNELSRSQKRFKGFDRRGKLRGF